ncbi:MAG TPA: outer membrane lipoprotein-sorting protein [Gammaproteobacteria bacterium]|nr:outer membrane lipoprotein-sorting protein [Gammaproteobacteria bacterium]
MKALLCLLGYLALTVHTVDALEITAKEILDRSEYAKGEGLPGLTVDLYVSTTEDGSVKERYLELKIGGLPNGTDDHSLAEFTRPARYKGQKLLTSRGNMWFVRPGLSKPVPISPRQKMLGSASNGDIASTNFIDNYEPKILREETVDGDDCYVLELKAINKVATYDRIVYWVYKGSFLGFKADYYTASGKLFKSATFEYDNQVNDSGKVRKFLSKMVINDRVQEGNVTVMKYSNVVAKLIPPSAFNLSLLVR